MLIDCDTCRMRNIACGDCVINLLLGAPQDSFDLDADEAAALGALAAGGLAPPLRLVPVSRSHSPDLHWHRTRGDDGDGHRTGEVSSDATTAELRRLPPRPGAVASLTKSVPPPAASGL
jgi:hypothetical protein